MPLLPQIERTEIVSCAYLLNVPIHFIQTARAVGAAARRGDAAQKKTSGPSQTVGGGGGTNEAKGNKSSVCLDRDTQITRRWEDQGSWFMARLHQKTREYGNPSPLVK